MDAYHVLAEDEKSFTVHQGGRQFKVAKKGLSAGLQAKLREHSAKSHLADGGEPVDFGPPGVVVGPTIGAPADVPVGPATLPGIDPSQPYTTSIGVPNPSVMSLPPDRPGPVIMPVDKTAVAPPPEPTSQVETPPAEKPQSLTAPVAPRVPSAIDTAGKQESEAISDRAKAETAKAEAAQALLDKQAQTAQEIETKRLERQKANDAQIDGLNGWLKDPKNQVDAGRWWSSKSTGQKVGAGLSMILGGLGQGLMRGGRNVALDVIDKQIDQDIDSQKENINNKKSLVAMYMNQGHTIDSAAEMARASLLSITKAQLDAKANLAVGPEQQAQLKSAQAELAMKIQAAKQSSAASQASVDHERASTRLMNLKAAQASAPQQPVNDDTHTLESKEARDKIDKLIDDRKFMSMYSNNTNLLNPADLRDFDSKRTEARNSFISAGRSIKGIKRSEESLGKEFDNAFPEVHKINFPNANIEEVKEGSKAIRNRLTAWHYQANSQIAKKLKYGKASQIDSGGDDESGQ